MNDQNDPFPDVVGAEAVGMKGVLVRRHHRLAKHSLDSLEGLPALLHDILSTAD
jgi:FMN phosphatase YigB (HAD superfamily)